MDRDEQRMGDAVRMAVNFMATYAVAYKARFEQPICDDAVIGQSWLAALKALQELLIGPLGHVDAGELDERIVEVATRIGKFTSEQVWA